VVTDYRRLPPEFLLELLRCHVDHHLMFPFLLRCLMFPSLLLELLHRPGAGAGSPEATTLERWRWVNKMGERMEMTFIFYFLKIFN
jgi:hypothetical protein